MQCPKCQFENDADAQFCNRCGTELELICSECGRTNKQDSLFCKGCGYDLTQSEPSRSESRTPSTPSIPTSFVDGRYEVKEFLGEGGKKKVYRTYDTLLDRDVAFSSIKLEGLDEDSRTRITREAQAMGRLGAHNNIVTVFDLGDDDGRPFIVSELMGGGDVEGLLKKAENNRLPNEQIIEIALAVCEGLKFAHGKAIIHRDLKPGNIWLTDDGQVKIGDFGLALVDDRTRLTQEGMMVGTVSYLPPEQAMGGEVTDKSDLYSLGAMLYEMATGRPPFVGDDNVAIIGQHINTPPVSPSWHNPEIPPALEALILRLLEKSAAKRSASALEVSRALESIQKGGEEEEPEKEDAQADKSGPLYRQVFVGRENELSQLKAAFDNALSGEGSLMMVVGEPGIGKTAITEQLATYVTMRGGMTLVGHCYEEGSLSLPYLAFVEAMRTYVLNREENDLRKDMGSGASEVARVVSEVRDKLDVTPREASNPDEDRYRLFQAVTDFLSNAAFVQPLLIVLEDLHDSDKGTLDLLTHIARHITNSRLLIVGTYRDVEVDRTHPLSSALAELRRASAFGLLRLRGLTSDEVQRMLKNIAGRDIAWSLAETVHRQTEGNPLFTQEVIRHLVEEGMIGDEKDQKTSSGQMRIVIPEGLRDVIGKRLTGLSPESNQMLAIASVIGREFLVSIVGSISSLDEDQLFKALKECANAAVIEERSSKGAEVTYRFAHAFFRQTLYEEMIAPQRIRLHQQVAKSLEKTYANRLSDHAVELAEHFSYSSNPADLEKAVQYGEMAAERATAVFDYGEEVRLLEQTPQVQEVLDPDDKTKRCDLLITLCEALLYAGRPGRVFEQEGPAALSLAEEIKDKSRASSVCFLALSALVLGEGFQAFASPEAAKWTKAVDSSAEPNTIERARADFYLGAIYLANYETEKGISLLDQALDLARKLDDPETFYLIAAGSFSGDVSRHAENLRLAEEIADRSRAGVIYWAVGLGLRSSLYQFLQTGELGRAEKMMSEHRALSERSGQPYMVIRSLVDEALIDVFYGRLEEAVDIGRRVMKMGAEFDLLKFAGQTVQPSILRPRLHLGNAERLLQISLVDQRPLFQSYFLALLGRTEEARDIVDQVIKDQSEITGGHGGLLLWSVLLLETAVLIKHHEAAEIVLNGFKGIKVRATTLHPTIISRHQGAAAAMVGRPDEARDYYQKAVKIATDMPFRPELALSRFQLAELQLEHFPDERNEALEHLDFALEEFKEMKMQPSLEKAEVLKNSL